MTVLDPPVLVDPATKQVAPIVKAPLNGYALGYALYYDLDPLDYVSDSEVGEAEVDPAYPSSVEA